MLMLKHFSPFLPKKNAPESKDEQKKDMDGLPSAATMAIMSARVGSISDNRLGGCKCLLISLDDTLKRKAMN